jgi:hypothetical protein
MQCHAMNSTQRKSHAQLLVGTSTKQTPGDRQRTHGSFLLRVRNVSTGLAVVPMCTPLTQAQKCERGASVSRAQGFISCHTQLQLQYVDVRQHRSGSSCESETASKVRPRGGTFAFNVGTSTLTASRSNSNRSIAGLSTRLSAHDSAESLLPVIMPAQAAPAWAIATHGGNDITALCYGWFVLRRSFFRHCCVLCRPGLLGRLSACASRFPACFLPPSTFPLFTSRYRLCHCP